MPYKTGIRLLGVARNPANGFPARLLEPGLQVDLRIVEADSFGAMIQYFTGSKQHNIRLRDYANQKGLSLNEYGITSLETGFLEKFGREEDFYERLGLQYIPPEIREGLWEIGMAEERALPELVQVSDIKGDLHVHSDWSDGHDPLEQMLQAAVDQGYEYVALTDHSSGRGIANGLSPERLLQQIQTLADLQKHYPIKVFSGRRLIYGPTAPWTTPTSFWKSWTWWSPRCIQPWARARRR